MQNKASLILKRLTNYRRFSTTGGLPKYGLTLGIFGICNSTVLHIQLDIIYLAFCCYLQLQFFNHHRYRADGILIPVLRQALPVMGNPF